MTISHLEERSNKAIARLTPKQQAHLGNVNLVAHGRKLISAYKTFNVDYNGLEDYEGFYYNTINTIFDALLFRLNNVIESLEATMDCEDILTECHEIIDSIGGIKK